MARIEVFRLTDEFHKLLREFSRGGLEFLGIREFENSREFLGIPGIENFVPVNSFSRGHLYEPVSGAMSWSRFYPLPRLEESYNPVIVGVILKNGASVVKVRNILQKQIGVCPGVVLFASQPIHISGPQSSKVFFFFLHHPFAGLLQMLRGFCNSRELRNFCQNETRVSRNLPHAHELSSSNKV